METKHLERISTILNYEIAGGTLYLMSFFHKFLIYLASLAALLFLPYLLYFFVVERKYGWLGFLIITLIIPAILSFLLIENPLTQTIINYVILGYFYLICFILKYVVKEWLTERLSKIERFKRIRSKNLSS